MYITRDIQGTGWGSCSKNTLAQTTHLDTSGLEQCHCHFIVSLKDHMIRERRQDSLVPLRWGTSLVHWPIGITGNSSGSKYSEFSIFGETAEHFFLEGSLGISARPAGLVIQAHSESCSWVSGIQKWRAGPVTAGPKIRCQALLLTFPLCPVRCWHCLWSHYSATWMYRNRLSALTQEARVLSSGRVLSWGGGPRQSCTGTWPGLWSCLTSCQAVILPQAALLNCF